MLGEEKGKGEKGLNREEEEYVVSFVGRRASSDQSDKEGWKTSSLVAGAAIRRQLPWEILAGHQWLVH